MRSAPKLCAVCAACALLGGTLWGLAQTTRFVHVTATEGTDVTVLAPVSSTDLMLRRAGVQAGVRDELQFTDAADGTAQLHVERSFAITFTDGGQSSTQRVVEGTVQGVLTQLGVTLGPDDYTEPELTAPVTRDTAAVTVHRVEYRDYTVDEVLPYETQYQYTSLFCRTPDRVMTIQTGRNGHRKADLRDRIVDGAVESTQEVTVYDRTDPVPEILKVYGEGAPVSAVEAPPGITVQNGVPSSYSAVYSMKATGYYSPRGKGASGLGLYYGTFAVDPTLIPYGTKVYIISENGKFVYGWAIATDTGAFIYSNRMQVDLFYETYDESAANAVGRVLVYVP